MFKMIIPSQIGANGILKFIYEKLLLSPLENCAVHITPSWLAGCQLPKKVPTVQHGFLFPV